jgi:hypothetical protein
MEEEKNGNETIGRLSKQLNLVEYRSERCSCKGEPSLGFRILLFCLRSSNFILRHQELKELYWLFGKTLSAVEPMYKVCNHM